MRGSFAECCQSCRQPTAHCTGVSCDDAGVYAGRLVRGVWIPVTEETTESPPQTPEHQASPRFGKAIPDGAFAAGIP